MNLFTNWRTTSLGISTVALAIYVMVSAWKGHNMDQALFALCVNNLLQGIGLVFSRDAAASAQAVADTKDKITALQNDVAQVKNDTSKFNKPNVPNPS